MKYWFLFILILFFGIIIGSAQSKKNARENNLRSSVILDIEGAKTLKNKTSYRNVKESYLRLSKMS